MKPREGGAERSVRFMPPYGTRRDRVVANRRAAMAQAPFPKGPGIMLRRMSSVKAVPSYNTGANASVVRGPHGNSGPRVKSGPKITGPAALEHGKLMAALNQARIARRPTGLKGYTARELNFD